MRTYALAPVLYGIAAAVPFEVLNKRECATLAPNGGGPVPGNGSTAAYRDSTNALWAAAANASTPTGYTTAFIGEDGATFQLGGYMTYTTLNTSEYDVEQCAGVCNSTAGCGAFNIYYERDSMYIEGTADGCVNPPPVTNINCALYNQTIMANTTSNTHQYDAARARNISRFENVIVGSNGYNLIPLTLSVPFPSPSPFSSPNDPVPLTNYTYTLTTHLQTHAITAPTSSLTNSTNTYMGYFLSPPSSSYRPDICAVHCAAKGSACVFFNSYVLYKNDVPQGTYCAFYTRPYGEDMALNGGYEFKGDVWRVADSYGYTLVGA